MTRWPVLKSKSGEEARGVDCLGDLDCPFCAHTIAQATQLLHIGSTCAKCHAVVIRFEDQENAQHDEG